MGSSWSDHPSHRPPRIPPDRVVVAICALIVCAWFVVMVGLARGTYDESPGMPDITREVNQ